VPEVEPTAWELTWNTTSSQLLDTLRLAMGVNATGAFDEFRLGEAWADVAVPTLVGDFNSDGRVDAADYVVWRKGFGTLYDQGDYQDWRANFGATLDGDGAAIGNGTGAIPEPAALPCLLIAILIACLRHVR
jgi:hypothetical protein